jgi:cysteine desulfurase / selenocysteine lyase
MLDLDALRADTPACRDIVHFNNAGASLMPDPVYDALTAHLALERRVGGYEAARAVSADLAAFYTEFAALLNADPDEIAYAENATRAWDMAFYGLPLQPGDRILAHASDYVSNYLALLQQAKRRDLHIDLVPSDGAGQIDTAALEAMITPRTRLISLTHVPTQGGLVNPVAEVGRIARKHGLIYLLDACQSVGQIALDVASIGCDILTGTGRKFLRGPRGTGFLYVRKGFLPQIDPPFIDLHSATWTGPGSFSLDPTAKRFENWESFVAGRIGLMQAVRYANKIGLDVIEQRVTHLAATLRSALAGIPGVTLHDQGTQKCGIVTFTKAGEDAEAIRIRLHSAQINLSVSPRSYALLDFDARGLTSLVRASVHYYNTEAEIERFVDVLAGKR